MTPVSLLLRRVFQLFLRRFTLFACAIGCVWTTAAFGDDLTTNSLLHYRTFGHGLTQELPEEVTVTSAAGGTFSFNNILYNGGVGIDVTAPVNAAGDNTYYSVNFPGANHQVQPGSYTGVAGDNGFSFNAPSSYYLTYQTTNWQILEAAYASDGTLIQLAANFEWLSADGQRALQGEVRYHSGYPLRSNVVFASDTFAASESANGLTVTINRNGDASTATSVGYFTEDYDALAGRDYTATQGALTWAAGDDAPKTFTVPLLPRTATGNRVFFVHLDGSTTGDLVTAAATITDDNQTPIAELPEPNGTVDSTYPVYLTNSGAATLDQVVPAPDGSAFIVGHFNSVNGQLVPGLVRLNPQGQVDATFQAQLPTTFTAGRVVLQSNGKLIVSGGTDPDGLPQASSLVRLNTDGSQDARFQAPTLHNGGILDLALQPDGRLVVSGNFHEGDGLLRLNTDGSLDAAFVRPTTDILFQYQFSLPQPDGKLLVCDLNGNVARLNADASVDATFQAAETLAAGQYRETVALQPDGKFLALTYYLDTQLNRFNHDGTLDSGFSFDSTTVNKNVAITAVVLQSDGKVLVGLATTGYGLPRGGIVRLNSDGSLDPTFQAGEGLPVGIATLALNSDGTLFLTGGYTSSALGNEVHTIFARLAAYPGGVEPTVTMTASAAAADRGTGEPVTVTFTRNGDLSAPMMVDYQLKGKAVAGTDYLALSGHKKIKAGQSTATIKITPLASGLGRGTLTVRVVLQPTSGYQPGTAPLKIRMVDPTR